MILHFTWFGFIFCFPILFASFHRERKTFWEEKIENAMETDWFVFRLQVTLEDGHVCGNVTSSLTEWPDNSSVTFQSIDTPVDVCYYTVFADVSNCDRFDVPSREAPPWINSGLTGNAMAATCVQLRPRSQATSKSFPCTCTRFDDSVP